MERSKIPGYERVTGANQKVEKVLRPLLELRPLLPKTNNVFKSMISENCPWHEVRKRKISSAEILKNRAFIMAEITCDDDTEGAAVAKSIVRQFPGYYRKDTFAFYFLEKINEKSCHAIRAKFPASRLRALEKLAAEKPDQIDAQEVEWRRPEDAGDYLCENRPGGAEPAAPQADQP